MSGCLSLPLKQSSPSLTKRLLWVLPRKCVINPKLVVSDGMHFQVHRFVLNSHSPPLQGNGTLLFSGKSHGRRSLVGCSPWGCEESDTTERLHFHFSLSCMGEGNGNPLQCPCLENPRDGEPAGLQSMGSHRVGHDWSNLAAAAVSYSPWSHRVRHDWATSIFSQI